ncbi:MAG: low molecular weight phosphotyrosine protein phosphatase [Selenomonadaceae bacterium]|nr:low molecular weight phosphotyrosine protein phosphatase [Selenomonadaceae bacterium]
MTKIVFVCFGNICRSPMAEFVMKHLVAQRGLQKNFQVESAGTHPSIGTPMSYGTAHELKKNNVPFTRRTSKDLLESDYERFDYIVGLDRSNVRDLRDLFNGDPDGKIFLLMDFAGEHRDVADPWYTEDYATTYRDVLIGCEALLEKISASDV